MSNVDEQLPVGPDTVEPLRFPHFPTRQQAVVWRNWELVPVERLARVLETTTANVMRLAADMGLRVPPQVEERWLRHGYITLIRNNWHLLPYSQLLTLLGWPASELAYVLKEDDFLWAKLGGFKPDASPVVYEALTPQEQARTAELRALAERHFPAGDPDHAARPFDFLDVLAQPEIVTRQVADAAQPDEIILDASWNIAFPPSAQHVATFVRRFVQEHEACWGHRLSTGLPERKLPLSLVLQPDSTLPAESHTIEVAPNSIRVVAGDEVGLLRGLQWLERAMADRGGPYLKPQTTHRKTHFDIRFIYPYCALYGDPLLNPELDPFPEGLLSRLSKQGVNGVWLQAILYTLYPWEQAPEMSAGYQKRLDSLRDLAQRAAAYGIGIYLYLNEPRGLSYEFFNRHPELHAWKGIDEDYREISTLCTSHPPVLDYLRESTAFVFREVPELAGVFTITISENPTNCISTYSPHGDCPRCSRRSPPEIVAEVNRVIEEGVHSAKPEAHVLAWNWVWRPPTPYPDVEPILPRAIDLLPENVALLCTSEEALPTDIGGVRNQVYDYTMSSVGPSAVSLDQWQRARRRGLKTVAKVQFNNTWECSAVPYIPVPHLVQQHIDNLKAADVTGLMLSWTLGGYPSPNLELAAPSYWEDSAIASPSGPNPVTVLAAQKFSNEVATKVEAAWERFSAAFSAFPFFIGVLYTAPQNFGPMNQLHATPTGLKATMIGFPYDDLDQWRRIYPPDVFEAQFRKLSEGWREGVALLDEIRESVDTASQLAFTDLYNVAKTVYLHFRSTYLQVAFVRLRDEIAALVEANDSGSVEALVTRILKVIDEEIDVAKALLQIVQGDSRIGYEASNHYYYTRQDLREKVLNCELVRALFSARNQS